MRLREFISLVGATTARPFAVRRGEKPGVRRVGKSALIVCQREEIFPRAFAHAVRWSDLLRAGNGGAHVDCVVANVLLPPLPPYGMMK